MKIKQKPNAIFKYVDRKVNSKLGNYILQPDNVIVNS